MNKKGCFFRNISAIIANTNIILYIKSVRFSKFQHISEIWYPVILYIYSTCFFGAYPPEVLLGDERVDPLRPHAYRLHQSLHQRSKYYIYKQVSASTNFSIKARIATVSIGQFLIIWHVTLFNYIIRALCGALPDALPGALPGAWSLRYRRTSIRDATRRDVRDA